MSATNHADDNDRDDPRGWLFWGSFFIGWAVIGFGMWTLFVRANATHPLGFGAWFVGLTVAHDLLIAPAISAVAVVLVPRVPANLRGGIIAAVIVSAVLVLLSLFPLLGDPADNASILPRNYAAGLAIAIAATWAIAAIWIVASLARAKGSRR
jgi:hypothetical protein